MDNCFNTTYTLVVGHTHVLHARRVDSYFAGCCTHRDCYPAHPREKSGQLIMERVS